MRKWRSGARRGDPRAIAGCGGGRVNGAGKGLACQIFLNWRRKCDGGLALSRSARSEETEFVEVELSASDASPGRGSADPAVELILAGGSILRIYPTPPRRS